MTYKYKWVYTRCIKKIKNKLIPLKGDKFLFNHIPVIEKGKYKGYMGIPGLVLCMVIQK
jgi:hypothetical protein